MDNSRETLPCFIFIFTKDATKRMTTPARSHYVLYASDVKQQPHSAAHEYHTVEYEQQTLQPFSLGCPPRGHTSTK